jgi:glucose/arabinose dehydrogenase/putative cell wall-binding protein
MRTLRSTVLVTVLVTAAALVAGPPSARAQEHDVRRLAGADRFATAAAVAADTFSPPVAVAYVATGLEFPDALASAPRAAADDAPVLLVSRTAVPAATEAELERLRPERIVVLGGEAAVAGSVLEDLGELTDGEVTRLAGSNRFGTAAAISETTFSSGVVAAYVANGATFPDALSGGAAAAGQDRPVLLVTRDEIPQETAAELARLEPGSIIVLGGTSAVSADVARSLEAHTDGPVIRLAGQDRFETAVAVSRAAFPDGAPVAFLATGEQFPDALSGGPAAAARGGPVLLTASRCVPVPVLEELDRLGAEEVVLLGGAGALAAPVERLAACGRETTVLHDGLRLPWDVAFTPDGRTFLTERDTGRLLEIDEDGARQTVQTIAVNDAGEGGLLGLAVSPEYTEDGLLYAYMTTRSDNRVVRFRPGSEPEPVVAGIPRANIHNGGRIAFGPDGMLYIATGDAADPSLAQDRDSLAGKILRVNPDGSVPPDNPFGTRVWTYGHRNVQGLAWNADGAMYASELGPACDDEINRIVAGRNYGWPDACGQTRAGAEAPVIVRQPPEASWSGATFLVDGAVPEWEGDLFVAALRGQRLWRFRLSAAGDRAVEAEEMLTEFGRLRHVQQAPDGSLWILTSNGSDDKVIRIGPPA